MLLSFSDVEIAKNPLADRKLAYFLYLGVLFILISFVGK